MNPPTRLFFINSIPYTPLFLIFKITLRTQKLLSIITALPVLHSTLISGKHEPNRLYIRTCLRFRSPHWNWKIPSLKNLPSIHDTTFTPTDGVILLLFGLGIVMTTYLDATDPTNLDMHDSLDHQALLDWM